MIPTNKEYFMSGLGHEQTGFDIYCGYSMKRLRRPFSVLVLATLGTDEHSPPSQPARHATAWAVTLTVTLAKDPTCGCAPRSRRLMFVKWVPLTRRRRLHRDGGL